MKFVTLFLRLWLFFFFWSNLFGQEEALYFHQLSVKDGLSQSTNHFLHTDKAGFTWIGSLDGLNMFDGRWVKTFKNDPKDSTSIQGTSIQSPFFEDEFGNIWFTTDEAINCYNRQKDVFTHDFAKGASSKFEGIHYAFYLEKNRYLWLINDGTLFRYDILRKKSELIQKKFNPARCFVHTDTFGSVKKIYGVNWMGVGMDILEISNDDGVERRDSFFYNNENNGALEIIQGFTDDTKGWVLSSKVGLVNFSLENPFVYQNIGQPSINEKISSIISYDKQSIWCLLHSSEIAIFNKKQNSFLPKRIKLFNIETAKKIDRGEIIFSVYDNILWIAEEGEGVFFTDLSAKKISSLLLEREMEEVPVVSLYQKKDGNIWLISDTGKSWSLVDDAFHNDISSPGVTKFLLDNEGTEWCVQYGTLSKRNSSHDEFEEIIIIPDVMVVSTITCRGNFLILGTDNGIKFYDKKSNTVTSSNYEKWVVNSIIDSKNRLWTTNVAGELCVWNLEQIDSGRIEQLVLKENLGITNHLVEDKDRNCIWIASSKGLVKFDIDNFESIIFTETDGLSNQYIYAIVIDQNKKLWLSSNKGVISFAPEKTKDYQFRSYTRLHGLSSDEYLPGAGVLNRNGDVLFGSTKGVDLIYSNQEIIDTPRLAIRSLEIHGIEWKGDSSISALKNIELPHNKNTLSFGLSAINYINPFNNKFKAYLEHNNRVDSNLLGDNNMITFANLSPGEYKFKFTASNSQQIWNASLYELGILIRPPYHQTWWFRAIMIVLILGIVSFLSTFYYRYQLRAKKLELEREKRISERKRLQLEQKLTLQTERNRIAGEMHDELGGGLSTIRNASEKALKRQNLDDLKSIFKRVSQISINLINSMREIIWAMDPDYDSIQDLMAHIRWKAKEFLNDNEIESEINTPIEMPDISISGPERHNIVLVIKETLHNIVKHADASFVTLTASLEGDLVIDIKDNGIGFDFNNIEKKGFGLRNMGKRMNSISGTISWEKNEFSGTTVSIRLPLEKSIEQKLD